MKTIRRLIDITLAISTLKPNLGKDSWIIGVVNTMTTEMRSSASLKWGKTTLPPLPESRYATIPDKASATDARVGTVEAHPLESNWAIRRIESMKLEVKNLIPMLFISWPIFMSLRRMGRTVPAKIRSEFARLTPVLVEPETSIGEGRSMNTAEDIIPISMSKFPTEYIASFFCKLHATT